MYLISNELKHYISLVSSICVYLPAEEILSREKEKYTMDIEEERKKMIETGVIALVKQYRNIPLDKNEEATISKYPLCQSEILYFHRYPLAKKNEFLRNIYRLVYYISFDIYWKAQKKYNSENNELCRSEHSRNINYMKDLLWEIWEKRVYLWTLDECNSYFADYSLKKYDEEFEEDKLVLASGIDFDSENLICASKTSKTSKNSSVLRKVKNKSKN